jgi:hypothetical protein
VAVCFSQWDRKEDMKNEAASKYITEEITTQDVAKRAAYSIGGTIPMWDDDEGKEKNRRRRNKLLGRLSVFADQTPVSESISATEVVDMFGGPSYFRRNFKTAADALKFVYDELSTFDVREKDVNKKKMEQELLKIIKK